MEHAAKAGLNRLKGSSIFRESADAALGVIHLAVDRLHPTGLMRYTAPVSFFYMTFAAAYLINVCPPFPSQGP
jgi:transcriptional regulatory protein LEU3